MEGVDGAIQQFFGYFEQGLWLVFDGAVEALGWLLRQYGVTVSTPQLSDFVLGTLCFIVGVCLLYFAYVKVRKETARRKWAQKQEQLREEALQRQRRLRASVENREPVSASMFLEYWKGGDGVGGRGFSDYDQPGCYVILIDPYRLENGDTGYRDVYVGQSMTMCSRVRQHLTGHGNGDVYVDVKNGANVQIRLIPTNPRELNNLEKTLIDAFHATKSYNKTKGGAKARM